MRENTKLNCNKKKLNVIACDLVGDTHFERNTKKKEFISLQACRVLREILL
jgi:hypothetical protein